MKENRWGRFEISDLIMQDLGLKLCPLFIGILVTRAERTWHKAATEYYAYSDKFDIVEPGEQVPTYEVQCHNFEGKIYFSFKRS